MDQEIRTGQGLFFTPDRLRQLKKNNRKEWQHAEKSYARRWFAGWIKRTIILAVVEQKKARHARRRSFVLNRINGVLSGWIRTLRRPDIQLDSYLLHPSNRQRWLRGRPDQHAVTVTTHTRIRFRPG